MKSGSQELVLAMCLVGAAVGFVGCGGDSSSDDTTTTVTNTVTNTVEAVPGPSATGTWGGQFATSVPFTMVLVQNGDAVTGSYASQGFPGTVSGTVSGGNISLTVSVDTGGPAVVSQWAGTINDAMNSSSGNFTIIAGGGGNGNWSMSK